jgi:hypothetical protein
MPWNSFPQYNYLAGTDTLVFQQQCTLALEKESASVTVITVQKVGL